MEEILRGLLELIKETSPHIWEIYLRQVYVDATLNGLWGVIMLGMSLWLCKKVILPLHRKGYNDRTSDEDAAFLLSGLACVVLFLLAGTLLSSSVAGAMNPEYQALQKLLETVGY